MSFPHNVICCLLLLLREYVCEVSERIEFIFESTQKHRINNRSSNGNKTTKSQLLNIVALENANYELRKFSISL